MEPLSVVLAFVFAAILLESIVTILKNVDAKNTAWEYWASLIGGIALGILIAVNWNLDIFKMVGFSDGRLPVVGPILTGFVLSRGSNYAADLLGRLNAWKQ